MVRLVSMMTKQNGIKEFMMVEYLEDVIQSVQEFVVTKNLVVSNSLFKKRESHLKTYQSGEKSMSNLLHPGQTTEHQVSA